MASITSWTARSEPTATAESFLPLKSGAMAAQPFSAAHMA